MKQKILKSIKFRMARNNWQRKAIEVSLKTFKWSSIRLPEINMTLNEGEGIELLTNYKLVLDIVKSEVGSFYIENGKTYFKNNHLTLSIQTAEEIFIIHEIYVKNIYNFLQSSDAIVIDIGMNVGFSSLYFALRSNTTLIYAFEPFKPTFNQAKYNFSLNKQLSEKIVPHDYGLSNNTFDSTVEYSETNRGRSSVSGLFLIKDKIFDTRNEKINLVKASDALKKIMNQHPNESIVVKMDCEGSEYEIIPELDKENLISSISVFMIEWHIQEPSVIIQILLKNNFKLFKFNDSASVGMIYAIK